MFGDDGRSYSYDSRGTGYGRGEGAVTLILKSLNSALRDGDNIRAIIRNTGVNQDGKTAGITYPSCDAQAKLIKSVYDAAGINPLETGYVEAHGTGTAVGDPIEAEAIARSLTQNRPHDRPLIVGSVKSNIGHLEPASGLAAIAKTIMALEEGVIPPNADFQAPNKDIDFEKLNIMVPTTIQPWPNPDIQRASISNFGFGGSNAHVILEKFNEISQSLTTPKRDQLLLNGNTTYSTSMDRNVNGVNDDTEASSATPQTDQSDMNEKTAHHASTGLKTSGDSSTMLESHKPYVNGHKYLNAPADSPTAGDAAQLSSGNAKKVNHSGTNFHLPERRLFVLSANDKASLKRKTKQLGKFVRSCHLYKSLSAMEFLFSSTLTVVTANYLDNHADVDMEQLSRTLDERRSQLQWREALSAIKSSELAEALNDRDSQDAKPAGTPKIGFVFTGQGAQWAKMGLDLLVYPAFEQTVDEAGRVLKGLGADWSLSGDLLSFMSRLD